MGKRYKDKSSEDLGINYFQPSKWQAEALEVIESNDLIFIDSVAGTGKTSIALYEACRQYLSIPGYQIVFVRTPADVGSDRIGFLPGSAGSGMEDKLGVHFESTKFLLNKLLGANKVECDTGSRIHFMIPNFILGKTIDNATFIIDESQMLQPLIMKLLLERIGQNTKTIVLGASGQLYSTDKNRNGLKDAMKRFFNDDMSKKFPNIGYYKFPIDAVMRSDIVKDIIRVYEGEE